MNVQNVDDILNDKDVVYSGLNKDSEPAASEPEKTEYESAPEEESGAPETDAEPDADIETESDGVEDSGEEESEASADEYGSKKQSDKEYYTRDEVKAEVNRAVRERLERMKNKPNQGEVEQIADDFEYKENEAGDWQQQLRKFIRSELSSVAEETAKQQQQRQEDERNQKFEQKFQEGMEHYPDFKETVINQPLNDNMVKATRALDNPAGFLYAASKNASKELERISQISDPYKQQGEMIRLEERLRKSKKSTKAPKPASKMPKGEAATGSQDVDSLINRSAMEKAKRKGLIS